jgi:hypothetical protein
LTALPLSHKYTKLFLRLRKGQDAADKPFDWQNRGGKDEGKTLSGNMLPDTLHFDVYSFHGL